MKRTNVLQALIFSIVILFGGTACDNANDERFSSTEEFTVEGLSLIHISQKPETDSEYSIHSAEEARKAIIWSEILQRKY